ncbi:TAXI family TRAP transporter solute-binding subunit [Marinibaculum pumilum]|uniref:TAXI family TRAP transporter solute-binding subunit n=1 Tax=Marinibaculum pumilum TaxID=1766165 RepID=A0ABV7L221_9PROT
MKARILTIAAAAAMLALPAGAWADDAKLPPQVVWTAYDTGSSGFNQVVAYGKALKEAQGTDIRVLPGSNDISRMTPLKTGRAQFSAMGVGSFFAQEGMDVFAAKGWGPQRICMLGSVVSGNAIAVGVAGDIGVKNYSDLKGKRIVWVVGSAALNTNMEAFLAFAGLTWDDVEKVEFSGYGASWKGLIGNQADAAIASTISGVTRELEASPRGIIWPPVPHDDAEGWKRMQAVAPYYTRHVATEGSGGISKENPLQSASYPYPIMIAYDTQKPELVYGTVKSMYELADKYKDGAPGADGWALDKQTMDWVLPFCSATIDYFKEAGVWNDDLQKHNDANVHRQDVLQKAWEAFMATDPAEEDYATRWVKMRAEGLDAAGLNPIWRQ